MVCSSRIGTPRRRHLRRLHCVPSLVRPRLHGAGRAAKPGGREGSGPDGWPTSRIAVAKARMSRVACDYESATVRFIEYGFDEGRTDSPLLFAVAGPASTDFLL
jgi:hypothetical protein